MLPVNQEQGRRLLTQAMTAMEAAVTDGTAEARYHLLLAEAYRWRREVLSYPSLSQILWQTRAGP